MHQELNLANEWLKFIEKFIAEQFELFKEKTETDIILFRIENYLKTEIDLSNEYGFLTLNFKNRVKTQSFISITGISHLKQMANQVEPINKPYSSDHYPCRVYFSDNGKLIEFYDSDKITDTIELLDRRVAVFEKVILLILKQKIIESK